MLSYEMMGLQYFYIGDIYKADYYLNRSLYGQSESPST